MADFKVDQISFVYFFPGMIVVFGIMGIGYDIPCIQHRFSTDMNLEGTAALALLGALSYVIGYACWIVGDQWPVFLAGVCNWLRWAIYGERDTQPAHWRNCGTVGYKAFVEVFRYVCQDEPLRDYYCRILRQGYYTELAETVGRLHSAGVFYDDVLGSAPTNSCRACKDIVFKGAKDHYCSTHGLSRDLIEKHGRRLWLLIWDWAYNRENQYHIGRFISSWNNLKFLNASLVACIVPLLLFGVRLLLRLLAFVFSDWLLSSNEKTSFRYPLYRFIGEMTCGNSITWTTVCLLVFLVIVFGLLGVRWRRKIWVRDLVHSLTPYSPKDQPEQYLPRLPSDPTAVNKQV